MHAQARHYRITFILRAQARQYFIYFRLVLFCARKCISILPQFWNLLQAVLVHVGAVVVVLAAAIVVAFFVVVVVFR